MKLPKSELTSVYKCYDCTVQTFGSLEKSYFTEGVMALAVQKLSQPPKKPKRKEKGEKGA